MRVGFKGKYERLIASSESHFFFWHRCGSVGPTVALGLLSLLPGLLLSPEGFSFPAACTTKMKLKYLRQKWGGGWVQEVEL